MIQQKEKVFTSCPKDTFYKNSSQVQTLIVLVQRICEGDFSFEEDFFPLCIYYFGSMPSQLVASMHMNQYFIIQFHTRMQRYLHINMSLMPIRTCHMHVFPCS